VVASGAARRTRDAAALIYSALIYSALIYSAA
jgi:hypothetical protein